MLAQYLPLHFVSTMQRLARKVGKLTLLLSEAMDASRDWMPDFDGLEVQLQRSLRVPVKHRHPLGFNDNGALIIPYSTVTDLMGLRPDVVISVEVGARTLQAAMLRKLRAGFGLIVQVRESENTAQSRGALRRLVRRTLLPKVDEVFVNGASGRRHVLACGVEPERISVVPSGTDTRVFGNVTRRAHPGSELRLLYVGQLIPRKGLMPFALALAEAARGTSRQIRWTIAGRGPIETDLRQIAWPANVRVEFVGPQPYQALPDVYAGADAFVMPSLSDEWGLVVNEAMASGLPIFGCTGAQSVEELVQPHVSGWTYAPATEAELALALQELLAASQQELGEMGHHARETALAVSDENTATAMVAGVRKVLRAPGSATPIQASA
jgi:glycosyltransferase involved in cell wall biosynthesis